MAAPDKDSHDIPQDVLEKLGDRYSAFVYISSGATSAVYKAHDAILDKTVALKVLKRAEEKDLIRFQKEARAASQLEHENLVHILDFNVTPSNNAFLIMEFVEGRDLNRIIAEKGHLPIELSLSITEQICLAMVHAHGRKICHRDLKASNIIVGSLEPPNVTIVDFGLAKKQAQDDTIVSEAGADLTTTSGIIQGSPLYMSPEQAQGQEADERSDIYSVGCIIFEMLTGRPPFQSDDLLSLLRMHVESNPPRLADISKEESFPQKLEALVARMLEKDKKKRFQTMSQLVNALRQIEDEAPPASISNAGKEVKETSKVSFKLIGSVIISITLVAVVFSVFFQGPEVATEIPNEKLEENRIEKIAKTFELSPNDSRSEGFGEKWYKKMSISDLTREDYLALSTYLKRLQEKAESSDYNRLEYTRLILKEMKVNSQDLEILLQNDIRFLDFSRCTFDSHFVDTLKKFLHLRVLVLEGTDITNDELNQLWTLPNLEQLDISNSGKITAAGFKNISQSERLRVLYFNSDWSQKGAENVKDPINNAVNEAMLANISKSKSLEKLYLERTAIDDECVRLLLSGQADKKNKLIELAVNRCPHITGKSLRFFDELDREVKYLGLAMTNIKTEDLVILKEFKELRLLNLMGLTVDKAALEAISQLHHIENIYIGKLQGENEDLKYLYHFEKPLNIVVIEAPSISKEAFDKLQRHYSEINKFKLVTPKAQTFKNLEDMGDILLGAPE